MAKQKSASSGVARIAKSEAVKELRALKMRIKTTPAGADKKKLLKDAEELAQRVDQLTVMAKG